MEYRWFVLEVNPEPWAIGDLSVGRKNGKYFPMVGRNNQLHSFKEAVREAIGSQPMIEGHVCLRFYFWRNQAEYKTPTGRKSHAHEADLTNLQKATEDALQGILFKNDRLVNDVRSIIVEQGPDVRGRVVVGIKESNGNIPDAMILLPDQVCELLDAMDKEQSPPDTSTGWGDPDDGIF